MWYPTSLIICWVPLCVDRIYFEITQDHMYWLVLVHMSLTHGEGFINALIYSRQDGVKNGLRKLINDLTSRKPVNYGVNQDVSISDGLIKSEDSEGSASSPKRYILSDSN